jgi:hypothetical protein
MNTLPPLIVVADRGHFIAYETLRNRGLRVISAVDLLQGHRKPHEQLTDRAGGFPNSGTMGKGNSSADRMSRDTEMDMQTFRQLAELLDSLLKEQQPDAWAVAIPSEINGAILHEVNPRWESRIAINLPKDLTRMPPHEVRSHFAFA